MEKVLTIFTVFLILMVAMGPVSVVAAPVNVYWTARSAATLNKTDVGSGTTSQLTSTNGRLQDVDLDAGTNTLYFADWGNGGMSGSINRIQTDGSGLGLVLGGGVIGDAVHQLALDQANNRIYFTRAVSYDDREISRVDTSGANYTQLHTGIWDGINGWFYSGLAVDVANNAIYWGDIGILTPAPPADGAVNSMTLTGAALTTLVPHVDGKGRGFALDQASQTLFYTAHDPDFPTSGGALYSYDIANNIETLLISDTDTGYWDIEIDPTTNRIWWTDNGRGQIWSANFDGSNPVVELTGLTDVYGLALEIQEPPQSCFSVNHLNIVTKDDEKGEVEIKGTFEPNEPIDLAFDDVEYTIDDGQGHTLVFLIPAGSFKVEGKPDKQKFKFHSAKGSEPDIKAKFDFLKCKFELQVKAVTGTGEIASTTLTIELQAGLNLGQELVEAKLRRLDYKAKPKMECCEPFPD